jgi:two-component system response regulator DesR
MCETLLIVDDNESFRTFTRALLAGAGFEVVAEAADGPAALEAARRLRPDVLLLDVQLPGIDGLEVARLLQAEASGTVIVLTSARDRAEYGRALTDCGARAFIAKHELTGRSLEAALHG